MKTTEHGGKKKGVKYSPKAIDHRRSYVLRHLCCSPFVCVSVGLIVADVEYWFVR